jgi:hypothetical protein
VNEIVNSPTLNAELIQLRYEIEQRKEREKEHVAAISQAKSLLCDKYEFEAAAKLLPLLKPLEIKILQRGTEIPPPLP